MVRWGRDVSICAFFFLINTILKKNNQRERKYLEVVRTKGGKQYHDTGSGAVVVAGERECI